MIINFIQDIPTPHNNALLRALTEIPGVKLNLWYSRSSHSQYTFASDLAHEVCEASIYGHKGISWKLLTHALRNRKERFVIVGWANPSTRVLVCAFWLLRFRYNMWFDLPRDDTPRGMVRRALRKLFYFLLKSSKATVFCVGTITLDYFTKRGFDPARLTNLPICVDIGKGRSDYHARFDELRVKYHVAADDFFITAGSRLIYDKGFDLLINALRRLPDETARTIKVVIVGKGVERPRLVQLVAEYALQDHVILEDWMDVEDFKACVSASDVFVHPARFDAFGGGTLTAMGLGVPVIASFEAGAARERITDGVNGFLYPCEDTDKLANIIDFCFRNRHLLKDIGARARETAERWTPQTGAHIVTQYMV